MNWAPGLFNLFMAGIAGWVLLTDLIWTLGPAWPMVIVKVLGLILVVVVIMFALAALIMTDEVGF